MEVLTSSYAGSLESGDVFVQIAPNAGKGIQLDLKSTVQRQFGEQIRETAMTALRDLGVKDALVTMDDKGALDPVIEARVAAAAYRAARSETYTWEV